MDEATSGEAPRLSDLDIQRQTRLAPIAEVGAKLGIPADALEPYGRYKAKLSAKFIAGLGDRPAGKLILVTGINPTSAGEGKTTTSIGLADALTRLGKRTAACLREPSLGPCFGQKGGATGGGRAQVAPMEEINLHFTGDMHAIAATHNLLSALVDNHLHWGGQPSLDARKITWPRTLDISDRTLRQMVIGLGGAANGVPRETRFDITPASEIMAILALAEDLQDLKRRLGEIVVGMAPSGRPVRAADLRIVGALASLMVDAVKPNLVQTLEATPAFVHAGPFANIAHGCSSVIATKAALRLAEVVVTEAGFGADLGAEKFFNIKCRQAGLTPDLAVIVATARALKLNGGASPKDLTREDPEAVARGLANLLRHVENIAKFGVPAVVAVNRFADDGLADLRALADGTVKAGVRMVLCDHYSRGGTGAADLARVALEVMALGRSKFKPLYPAEMPLADKIGTVAREIYRADQVVFEGAAKKRLGELEMAGFGKLPICIAKTQYSFSNDPAALGAPVGHTLRVRDVRLAAGAGFVVALCGDIMTMPGLPRVPAAMAIDVDADGLIQGLS